MLDVLALVVRVLQERGTAQPSLLTSADHPGGISHIKLSFKSILGRAEWLLVASAHRHPGLLGPCEELWCPSTEISKARSCDGAPWPLTSLYYFFFQVLFCLCFH